MPRQDTYLLRAQRALTSAHLYFEGEDFERKYRALIDAVEQSGSIAYRYVIVSRARLKQSRTEVADYYNVTNERIRQMENMGFMRLQHYVRTQINLFDELYAELTTS